MSRASVLTAALILLLTSCTGSLFETKAPPPTIYLLSAGAGKPATELPGAAAPAAEIPVDLSILKPRVRAGLETDRIAALYPDRHLDYFANARWGGPLDEVLQDLAVQVLHAHAKLRSVSGDASVFASAYWMELEVTDFQAEYSSGAAVPTVHVHFLASIGSSGDRRILGRFEADARQAAADNRLTPIVDAYVRAADAALTEIGAHAADILAGAQKIDKPVASANR